MMGRPGPWVSAGAIALLVACNALLGNEEGVLVNDGTSGTGAAGGAAGEPSTPGEAGASSDAGATSGGNAAGGSTNGGAASGGSSSGGTAGRGGGASTGGTSTGGTSTGGVSSGGASSGGGNTGGVGTGGASTGGSASGGTAPDLPLTGMELWFMADQGVETTVVGADERVSRWEDQSPAPKHAVQANAELQPRRVEMESGPPMIEFDGKDDGTGDALELPDGFATFTGASFFVVAEAFENTDCAGILSLSNGDDGDDIEFGRHKTNLLYYEVLHEYVEGTEGAFEVGRRLLGTIVQSDSGYVELRLNGAITGKPATISLPANVVRGQNFVGKNTYDECPAPFGGRIGELILYSRGLSTSERERVEAYLGDKWDI